MTQDFAKAAEWYRKSAEQGYARAQCNLGYFYENGRGVEKDLAKAVEWYRKSAEQGYARAQYNLGRCYHNEQGVARDLKKLWSGTSKPQNKAGQMHNISLENFTAMDMAV